MHAFETDQPDLSVVLPTGWSVKNMSIENPLVVSPFGGENECYYNILGDSLVIKLN